MATRIQSSLNDKTKKSINATNYKRALNALENSNFDEFVPLKSNKEILNLALKPKGALKKVKDVDKLLEMITALFQSMTTQGFTTYEIVNFIASELNNFDASDRANIIEFLESSYTIVHADYSGKLRRKKLNNVSRILFNHFKEDEYGAYTDLGYRLIGLNNSVNRDIKTLCLSKKESIIKKVSQASNVQLTSNATTSLFNTYYNNININKNIKNPTKNNPSYSCIMVNNPDVRVGSRNALELATFFNSVSNVEFSRAYPYFNAEFVIPNYSKQDINAVMHAASINQFINGNLKKSKTTSNYRSFEGKKVKREDDTDGQVIKTNMALFTTPQTLVNLDEETGHGSNKLKADRSLRLTSIKDSTQPFMTLKNLSINVAPTKGFMSYKTGKLSLVLHDRSRLVDVAPFVKPDLFGSFGSEIILEYGWSHMDEDDPNLNPVGSFLGNSKVKEVYMIVNSSFSMEQGGLINIDLSIAMKGPSLLKNTEISFVAENRVRSQALKSLIATISSCRQTLKLESSDTGILQRLNSDNILNPTSKIDKDTAIEMSQFVSNFGFLDLPDLTSFYQLTPLPGTKDFALEISPNNGLLDSSDSFLSLILGNRLDDSNNPLERIISCNYTESEIRLIINDILNAHKELRVLTKKILDQDSVEEEIEAAVLESIVGGIELIDPFFPTNSEFYDSLKEPASFVTFGSVLNSLLQTHVLSKTPQAFDEIQTIFYTANQWAAGMKDMNLATILIPKQELKEFIKKEIKKEGSESNRKTGRGITVLTVESLISQIINKFVVSRNNPMFGLSDLYKLDKNQSVVAINDDTENQKSALEAKLHKIYYPKALRIDKKNDITFKVPSIRMAFDSLNSDSIDPKKSKTILRISIYDQNDTPFDSISNILEKLYLKDFNKSIDSLNKIKNQFGNTGSKTLYFDKIEKELNILKKEGFLKIVNGKHIFDPLKKENAEYSIKEFYKKLFPSLTYGTQHTAILSANVSTVNENKLNTVYITRSDRNNQSELNSRIRPDLPLRVMPTQASLEIFGCPWVNFGQFIFLDFDTGTTIDNKYAVTGITHNLTPGNFKTSLTLSYGDVYGQYEAAADLIESVTSQLNVDKKSKKTISNNNKNIKMTSRDDIVILGRSYKTSNSSYFESRLVTLDNPPTQQIKFISPIYEDNFQNYSNLLIFNNNSLNDFISLSRQKSKSFINETVKNNSNNVFVTKFSEYFRENKEAVLDTVILDDPQIKNNSFTFNVIKSLQNKPHKLLVAQKPNSVNIVAVRNPVNLAAKTSESIEQLQSINYNTTAFSVIKNFKSVIDRQIIEIKKKNPSNASFKIFDKSLGQYYDILEHIDKAGKKNGGILSLRLKTFTLNDLFSDSFLAANEDKWFDFGIVNRGEVNRKLTEADLVKVTYSGKGDQAARKSAYKVKDAKIKLERLASLKNSKDTSISKVEYNVGMIRKIIKNDLGQVNIKTQLSSYQNFSIFKNIFIRYSSTANLTISNSASKVISVSSQSGQIYYDVSLNGEELKRAYDNTNIIDIHVEGNETQEAKLVIIAENYSANDFVEYNEETSRFINIYDMDFDLISIFNKNYVYNKQVKDYSSWDHNKTKTLKFVSRGVSKSDFKISRNKPNNDEVTSPDEDTSTPDNQLTRLNLKYNDTSSKFSPSEDNIISNKETITYEIQISEIVEYIKKQNSDYLEAGHELYVHNKEKILGASMTKKSQSQNILVHKEREKKPYNINAQDSNGQSATSFGWNVTQSNNLKQIGQQVEANKSVYRGIKESNLPAVNKEALNLKVMEKWIPPAEITSNPDTQEVDIQGIDPINYTSITNNFKSKNLETIRQQLNKQFFNNIKASHVDFEAVLPDKKVVGQAYLDYKVSDLTIFGATPNQEGIKGTLAKISYRSLITKNHSKISVTTQRRTKIQPSLYYLLYAAAEYVLTMEDNNKNKRFENAFDNLFIRTGGDIPLYLKTSRNLSKTIRHDGGYAADIQLFRNKKPLQLRKASKDKKLSPNEIRDNEVIWTFLKACKELGATGIGADYDYDGGKAFHIDIAKLNPDFSDDKYRRKFKIQPTGDLKKALAKKGKLDKEGNFIMTQAMVSSSTNDIMNARYWGKGSKGSYRKEAAPPNLKAIFDGKIT